MSEITNIGGYAVEIHRRSRQRYIRLRVTHEGRLRISCGRGVPLRDIQRFVGESETFVQRSLRKIAEQRARHPKKKFESGETFLFFGERLRLVNVWSWEERCRVERVGEELEVVAPIQSTREERRAAVLKYFQKLGHLHLKQRLEHFALKMRLRPRKVSIRGQSSRWGSCSFRQEISLNWKLISAPPAIIDYVVVHELAHLAHLNHSPRFWNLVGDYFPEYSKAKRWLREHEEEIAIQFKD